MTPAEAMELYRLEREKSHERNAAETEAHMAHVARIIAAAEKDKGEVGANGRRRGKRVQVGRKDPLELLTDPRLRP